MHYFEKKTRLDTCLLDLIFPFYWSTMESDEQSTADSDPENKVIYSKLIHYKKKTGIIILDST